MDKELREIAELTGELLGMLEGFWSECHASTLLKAQQMSDDMDVIDL